MGVLFKHINTGVVKSVGDREIEKLLRESVSWVEVDQHGNPIHRGAPAAPPPPKPAMKEQKPQQPQQLKKIRPA